MSPEQTGRWEGGWPLWSQGPFSALTSVMFLGSLPTLNVCIMDHLMGWLIQHSWAQFFNQIIKFDTSTQLNMILLGYIFNCDEFCCRIFGLIEGSASAIVFFMYFLINFFHLVSMIWGFSDSFSYGLCHPLMAIMLMQILIVTSYKRFVCLQFSVSTEYNRFIKKCVTSFGVGWIVSWKTTYTDQRKGNLFFLFISTCFTWACCNLMQTEYWCNS